MLEEGDLVEDPHWSLTFCPKLCGNGTFRDRPPFYGLSHLYSTCQQRALFEYHLSLRRRDFMCQCQHHFEHVADGIPLFEDSQEGAKTYLWHEQSGFNVISAV